MVFKDLKQGYTLHVLDKDKMVYGTEKVQSVSMPHIDAKMTAMGMVVDVTTDKETYCMPADTDVAYPKTQVISTERQHILRELESIKATSEQSLAQTDHHREMVTKCNQLLADLDPAQKEKQQNEERFAKIEANQAKIMEMLEKLTR